ncbi:amino acid transporter [Paenibacillus cellulosilyticus]|uniref:Amino acid transporter n=1 Tax=Paenibacillus cellulosilyticus TaxID=375489 RepID=A0A2V2Z0N1_9BACL|nr:amino acid permease [Paenibacillus cellulosilyticus]PWW00730.1 amino acid transporter [Paenibacillus cellulosilyticus]QKS45586.1 amino acid permease [Paenibacillus cellulosilyticus]
MIIGLAALAVFAIICLLAIGLAYTAGESIRASRHQSYGGSTYAQLVHDKDDLNRMGFPQLLLRNYGSGAAFGLSFQQLGLIAGMIAVYGLAIEHGGWTVIGWGWLILGLFGIATGAALAELSSAFPTAGGPYHWALALGGVRWSWVTGLLHWAGHIAMLALTNYFGGKMLDTFAATSLGYRSGSGTTLAWMALFYVLQWRLNLIRARQMRRTLGLGTILTVGIAVFAIAGIVWLIWPGAAPAASLFDSGIMLGNAGLVDSSATSVSGWLIGLLLLQRMFIGSEGGAAGAEETADPRVRSAWAIFLSPVYMFVLGFVLLCTVTISLPFVTNYTYLPYGSWVAAIMQPWLRWDTIVMLLLIFGVLLSGVQNMNVISRTLFAASRDGVLPERFRTGRISARTGKPSAAITYSAVVAGGCGLVYIGWMGGGSSPLIALIGFSIIAIQLACAIPIGLRLLGNKEKVRTKLATAPWKLGFIGTGVSWLAWGGMIVSAAGCMLLLSPYAGAAAGGLILFAWLASLVRGNAFKQRLQTASKRSRAELQRIERKFGPLFLDGK